MKIDPSKKYRTRSGRTVEFLHRAPEGWPGERPWRGIVAGEPLTWMDNGSEINEATGSADDLVEVREPMRLKMLVKDEFNMRWIYTSTDVDDLIKDGWTLKEFVEVMP
jgi:hypothetical protein